MNNQIKLAIIAIIIVIPLASLAITQPNLSSEIPTTDNSKLQVVTSANFLYEFSQNIGKEMIDVTLLVPMGADPHDWEPTIRDTERLQEADMIIVNGIGYEHWLNSLEVTDIPGILVDTSNGISTLDSAKYDEEKHDDHAKEDGHDEHTEEFYEEIAHVIEEFEEGQITQLQSIEEIEEILLEHEGDGHGHEGAIEDIENLIHEIEDGHMEGAEGLEEIHHLVSGEDVHDDHAKEDGHDEHEEEGDKDHTYDPHIWLDPILAKSQVMTIADHLKESDPEHAEIYHNNSISYANQLDLLDQEIRSDVSSCAKDTFVPFHNAFSYFAERYDLNTLAVIQEFSPETPVTAKDIEELIHFAEDNDIKYFFTEENRNPRIAERLATELGGDILKFSPLESLTAEDNSDTTYFDKMRQNVDNLQIALECN